MGAESSPGVVVATRGAEIRETNYDPQSTPSATLFKEFVDAADRANGPHTREWLARHGVPPQMLYQAGNALVGVARIRLGESTTPDLPGIFEPHHNGHPAILVRVSEIDRPIFRDDGGGLEPLDTIIDLLAWRPDQPDRLYMRTGEADNLNPEAIRRAWECDRVLVVHRNPLEWLRGNGAGTVVLNWLRPPATLLNCRRIVCGDRYTLARLKLALAKPGPKIRLWEGVNARR